MGTLFAPFGVDVPVLAAPMAGGPTSPELVSAAAGAGSFGFLAGGYKSPEDLAAQLRTARGSGIVFGVNLFAPNPTPVAAQAYRRYAAALQPVAERLEVTLPAGEPIEDDDHWHDKIGLLLDEPPPVASFTFGIPDRDVVVRLRRAGVIVVQTVTSPTEALAAVENGVDGLIVQAAAAGGHSATLDPARPVPDVALPGLVTAVRGVTGVPIVAAGGIAGPDQVAAAIRAGAEAVMVGTLLLRADEAGTSATHRAALADPRFTTTVVTHAFTGRPARALRNDFTDRFGPVAPHGYPALHHLTSPIRKAAAQAGQAELLHLWAGTGFRAARTESAATTIERLASGL